MKKIIEKQYIQYLFIYKFSKKETLLNFGFLDKNFNLDFFDINFQKNIINFYIYKKIFKIFSKFKFDKNSQICLLDNIEKKSIIYMYLHLLSQQIGFNLKFVSLDIIPRRICNYHDSYKFKIKKFKNKKNQTDKDINRNHLIKIWNKLVETEICPWINSEINAKINLKSKKQKIIQIRVRLGLYYMIIKKFLYEKIKKTNLKNKKFKI